jgi:UDP-glucuronate 4-epimerase
MRVLLTGAAGFIGYHTATALLARGDEVVGVDNVNDYYDPRLKEARVERLVGIPGFTLIRADIADRDAMARAFAETRPDAVINLAAQAGVRYSITHPHVSVQTNITGFLNVLEGCKLHGVKHLVYASSSSVYGANTTMPWSVHHNVDHPLTLYAVTKKANELMAHNYAHLFRIPVTGLRFFTAYGPWGRPDMALFIFTKAILEGRPIDVFNNGQMSRDFTFVDDIVEGIVRVLDRPPVPNPAWSGDDPDPATSNAPYRVFNIGNSRPTELMRYIELIEETVGKKAIKNMLPMQQGDIPASWADVDALTDATGYTPRTPVEVGVPRFVEWYREFYGV